MDPRVRQHNPRPRRVLDREFGLAVFPREAADAAREVLSPQSHPDVFHLETFDVEIVESKQGHGILQIKAQHESMHEISGPLQAPCVFRGSRRPELDALRLEVHPHVQGQVARDGPVEVEPGLLERREAVLRDRDLWMRGWREGGEGSGGERERRSRSKAGAAAVVAVVAR